ncbi:C-type lectin domain family 4 member E [Stylophora pistillata]|uniref:C-type lectin domain family 4 member E n=1 Tax=Stylophora pistillata TaxID=50429 RepID=A0A2B4SS64_STYPI|nr:C-type lectin domain family 4 member E [Stylophora pistillata]
MGVILVTFNSLEENQFVTSLAPTDATIWIGDSEAVTEGTWLWLDGGNWGGYANWGGSNPNNSRGNENCALTQNGKWNDSQEKFRHKANMVIMNPLFLMLLLSSCIAVVYTRSGLCGRNGGMVCPPGKREQLMEGNNVEDAEYKPLQPLALLMQRRYVRPELKRVFYTGGSKIND